MSILIAGLQNRVKNSAAYAQELGLMLIANGEELPYLLSAGGERITAGITAPTAAPTVADGGSGILTDTKWIVYVYSFVAENQFPLVGFEIDSNPSPDSAPYQITGGGTRQNIVSFVGSANPIITHVYVYRTQLQTTSDLAVLAAQAGALNFVGKVANAVGALSITDNLLTNTGNALVAFTNFTVPQFRFVVWDGSYFWGWANQPFTAIATWAMDGTISLADPTKDKFYGGRDNQYITFSSVVSGGIDNRGTYLFKQTGISTGKVVNKDGSDTTLPSTTTGTIVIIGESGTLYRSAYRNPFAWGYNSNVGGTFVPIQWALKVSGSIGTAIAIVPEQQLLKLDMEYPALCVTFVLQTAETDVFSQTRRQVSNLYSVTSHFSEFPAMSQGRQVLWGFDFKNLAVLQSDGYTQVPISGPISILLRNLTKNRSLHLLCHGTYDPETECNLIWLSSANVDIPNYPTQFDFCIYQHAPTGFWGVIFDYGILTSAPIEDPNTTQRSILLGTETGFVGKAFDPITYGNWLPATSLQSGKIWMATSTSITRAEGQDDFDPTAGGLIGNFCQITNSVGLKSQIVRITGATGDTLFFTPPLQFVPETSEDSGLIDTDQWEFFIGLTELRMLKYFDDGIPSTDKAPREYWVTAENAENPTLEFFNEHTQQSTIAMLLAQDTLLDAWFTKFDLPIKKGKTYGLAVVERSYNQTRIYNFTKT